MSDDVREKVARALHGFSGHNGLPDWLEVPEGDRDYYRDLADAAIAAHLQSLGDEDVAVVALPGPSYTDEPEEGRRGIGFNGGPADTRAAYEHGVYAFDGMVYDQYDQWSPEQARMIGSWWLAAASAAEDDR